MTSIPPMAAPLMTLCALSATAPNPRPSGESVAEQEARILAGINEQLVLLGSTWVANWLVLTADRANLAYIATEASTNSFAVAIRGTQFNSLVDLAEDMEVSSLAQFTAGGGSTPLLIATGTMNAFTEMTNAVSSIGWPRTNMLQQLQLQLGPGPDGRPPNLYVTGHSLGGCMATVTALYLAAQSWAVAPTFGVYTFAAPTAGLQAFADFYDATFPDNSWRIYNDWDVVPNAWASLQNVIDNFYPSPGPGQTAVVHSLLKQIAATTDNNTYVQTNQTTGTVPLNESYGVLDPGATCATTADWFAQLATQHANDTYLKLLGASSVPAVVPSVSGITPNSGPGGGVAVSITGKNFSSDCVVDFGTVPAAAVDVVSSTQITAIAPPAAGTVDVRVTNFAGTSAANRFDQFTAPSPTGAPTVTAISPYLGQDGKAEVSALSPNGGPIPGGTTVTVSGTGFVTDPQCVVRFGGTAGTNVQIVSLTELTVVSPPGTAGTVDVTVTNQLGTSATSAADQFTYGPPVVASVKPSCGPAKGGSAVTIEGGGFEVSSAVFFGKKAGIVNDVSATQITVMPPEVSVPGGTTEVVDVTVKNSDGQTSPLVKKDIYTFYPGK